MSLLDGVQEESVRRFDYGGLPDPGWSRRFIVAPKKVVWETLLCPLLLPARVVALQPPAGRIPIRCRVLREESAGASFIRGSKVVVFGFVALECGRQVLFDRDIPHAAAMQIADLKHRPIETVEDGQADDEVLCGFSQDSHESAGALRRWLSSLS